MKLFLDDVRKAPQGWYRAFTADEAVEFLCREWPNVDEISLDHDLGEDENIVGNGYQVVLWIEEFVHRNNLKEMPKITVHSSNSSARQKMEAGIFKCQQLCERNRCKNS